MGSGQSTPISPIKDIIVDSEGKLTISTVDKQYGPWKVKGSPGESITGPAGVQGLQGLAGPEGLPGLDVKPFGEWTETDKSEFILAIRTNEDFKDSVKNKLNTDNVFLKNISETLRGDIEFATNLQNALASDEQFRTNVSKAVNNVSFQSAIKSQVVTELKKDNGFKLSIKGESGDTGVAGINGYLANREGLTTEVGAVLAEKGLWCANGNCILPSGSNVSLDGGVQASGAYFGSGNLNEIDKGAWGQTLNIKNRDGKWTHFNSPDGKNLIRGYTEIDGLVSFVGNTPDNPQGNGIHIGKNDNYSSIQLNGPKGARIDFAKDGEDFSSRIMHDSESGNLSIQTKEGASVGIPTELYVKGRNILNELDNMQRDLNQAVRKDKRYNIRADRNGLSDNKRYLTRYNQNIPEWSDDPKGEFQKFNFEEY